MKVFPLLAAGLALLSFLQAAPPEVTNVRAAQRAGTKIIDITYDLTSPDNGASTIQIEISLDGGITYRAPVHTITGAIGENVAAGNNKVASWNAGVDFDGNLADNCRARVSAFDGDNPTPPVGMVYIPPGTFQMGDLYFGNPDPAIVSITKGYFIWRSEMEYDFLQNLEQWAVENGYANFSLTGETGYSARNISWGKSIAIANALSERAGMEPSYYKDAEYTEVQRSGGGLSIYWKKSAGGFRLPTSAEWEKAARGGLVGKRFAAGDTVSNGEANISGRVETEGLEYDLSLTEGNPPENGPWGVPPTWGQPNGYGLYQITGNFREWVWDHEGGTLADGAVDPTGGPRNNSRFVYRSEFYSNAANSHVVGKVNTDRFSGTTAYGIRLVRNVPE